MPAPRISSTASITIPTSPANLNSAIGSNPFHIKPPPAPASSDPQQISPHPPTTTQSHNFRAQRFNYAEPVAPNVVEQLGLSSPLAGLANEIAKGEVKLPEPERVNRIPDCENEVSTPGLNIYLTSTEQQELDQQNGLVGVESITAEKPATVSLTRKRTGFSFIEFTKQKQATEKLKSLLNDANLVTQVLNTIKKFKECGIPVNTTVDEITIALQNEHEIIITGEIKNALHVLCEVYTCSHDNKAVRTMSAAFNQELQAAIDKEEKVKIALKSKLEEHGVDDKKVTIVLKVLT